MKHRTALVPNSPTTGQLAKRNNATISKKCLYSHVHCNTITKAWSQTRYPLTDGMDKGNAIIYRERGWNERYCSELEKKKMVACDNENPGIVLCERSEALQKGKSYCYYFKGKIYRSKT